MAKPGIYEVIAQRALELTRWYVSVGGYKGKRKRAK
jgi:hypothetical protein